MKKYFVILVVAIFMFACSGNPDQTKESEATETESITNDEDLQSLEEATQEIIDEVEELSDEADELAKEVDELIENL